MANRYLRATGAWHGAVWASTAGGSAGSAATPTASDDVYISANYTVTLTQNAYCSKIFHTNGTINLSSYLLWCRYRFDSTGSTARTVNLQSGTLELPQHSSAGDNLNLSGSNLSWNAGTSLVKFGTVFSAPNREFNTLSKTFNDVQINLGGGSDSTTLSITGSPTFRSLIIQSKNGEAHTVNIPVLDSSTDAAITVEKFVAVGASSSNKITFSSTYFVSPANNLNSIKINDSCYGENLNFLGVPTYGTYLIGSAPRYLGVNTTYTDYTGVLQQNPSKISTLIDPLTTTPASNTNWTVMGSVSQITTGLGGGGYLIDSSSSLVSTDTFDLVDSEIIFERVPNQNLGKFGVDGIGELVNSIQSVGAWEEFNVHPVFGGNSMAYYSFYETGGSGTSLFSYPISSSKFLKIKISSGNLIMQYSDDGVNWTTGYTQSIPSSDLDLFRSTRIMGMGGTQRLGSIGMLPTPPTTKLLKQNGRFIKANGKYLKL